MSNEEEKRCPLCAEEMDWTDQQLKPCKCGYEVCVWCWHHIMDMAEKDATEGRCPACRTPYDKDRIVEANFQRVSANSSSRKQKQPKAKQKPNEPKKDLSNVRVIQRKMAYIIGLPLSIADEDLLQRKDYFGQYGKVTKVSLSRTAGGTVQQFVNDTCSVYITYSKEEEAVRCIQSVHGYMLDGRFLRASFGTAKYCHAWLRNMPCNNPTCLYLHSIGADEDSFGKDEIAAVHTRNRVEEIVGATQYLHKRSGSTLPSPVDQHMTNLSSSPDGPKVVDYGTAASNDQLPRPSKHMTTFVDIVGRSDKEIPEGRMVNLCSDISSICINRGNIEKAESSDTTVSSKPSFPGQTVSSKSDDVTFKETNITKEQQSGDERWRDSISLSQKPFLNPSEASEHDWWNMDFSSENGNVVNNDADEGFKQSTTCTNSVFESLGKSDRIYRSSKAFSNEEIVEHLRRLDDDNTIGNDDENSAAVESSIISNILSMDFDESDDSVLPGLFERKDGWHANANGNANQSRFSFANQEVEKLSHLQTSHDNIYNPASRVQNLTPPGFSKPPPGFSSSMRSEQVVSATPGSYVKNHYRTGSIGNVSDDVNLMDPAIMVVGRGKSSSFDMRSNSLDEETKLWYLMQQQQQQQQQSSYHHHDPQYSQTSSLMPQFSSSYQDDYYGDLNSRIVDQQHHQSQSQRQRQQHYLQHKYGNGNGNGNGNGHEVQQVNSRSEVGGLVGLDKLLPGYGGEYMFQMPTSGDVYTRVFGM